MNTEYQTCIVNYWQGQLKWLLDQETGYVLGSLPLTLKTQSNIMSMCKYLDNTVFQYFTSKSENRPDI